MEHLKSFVSIKSPTFKPAHKEGLCSVSDGHEALGDFQTRYAFFVSSSLGGSQAFAAYPHRSLVPNKQAESISDRKFGHKYLKFEWIKSHPTSTPNSDCCGSHMITREEIQFCSFIILCNFTPENLLGFCCFIFFCFFFPFNF